MTVVCQAPRGMTSGTPVPACMSPEAVTRKPSWSDSGTARSQPTPNRYGHLFPPALADALTAGLDETIRATATGQSGARLARSEGS